MPTKKVKHQKLDPYFISLKQRYEIEWVINRFQRIGIAITAQDVKDVVKKVGKSRKKVYNYINKNFSLPG